MEVKLPDDLKNAAQSIKDHLNYHLSGRWASDGFEKGKNPYVWMRIYDRELGVRVRAFQELFRRASKEAKENSVKIFLDELDRFLNEAPDFPELWDFYVEVTQIGVSQALTSQQNILHLKLIMKAGLYRGSAFYL